MRKKIVISIVFAIIFLASFTQLSYGQFTLAGQIRTRTEVRDGFGTPLPKKSDVAIFTSQRSRLTFGYAGYRLKFGASIQDVRVWGQDVSTINRNTVADYNDLMLHEAWAEIMLTDTAVKNKMFLKVGRQEIIYDDSRLLGNLDWLQQARRHDAAIFKYEAKKIIVNAGFAFNQNSEKLSNTTYNNTTPGYPANTNAGSMYKSFEYLYAAKKLKEGTVSFLFFADQFNKFHMSGSTKIIDTGTWTRATTGLYYAQTFKKLSVNASGYYQFGKNAAGAKLNAQLLTANVMYAATKKLTTGLGVDYYSGGTDGTTSKAFDPLYGTPHKFAGYMDYYYVAWGAGKAGLIDAYVRAKYKATAKCVLALDVHQFIAGSKVVDGSNNTLSKNLGTEIDITATHQLTKEVGFEFGYSHYFTTSTLNSVNVKNVSNAKAGANWFYAMIIIKPTFLVK
ncbi:MAG: alginate export family protein [Bacteroidota bacterium]